MIRVLSLIVMVPLTMVFHGVIISGMVIARFKSVNVSVCSVSVLL